MILAKQKCVFKHAQNAEILIPRMRKDSSRYLIYIDTFCSV